MIRDRFRPATSIILEVQANMAASLPLDDITK